MQNFELRIITGLLLVVLMGTVSVSPALAEPTTSGHSIKNALQPSGTMPEAPGELSVAWNSNGETLYDKPDNTVTTTVDTGFDMHVDTPINDMTVGFGDSEVYSIGVTNKSNNAQMIPFNFNQIATSGKADSFTYELYAEDGGDPAQFDTGQEKPIPDTNTNIYFAENEKDTIYAVITPQSTATEGDTIENRLFATDNAPISSGNGTNDNDTPGDQWEDGSVIGYEDNNDTQYRFYQTTVAGAALEISKSIASDSSSGSYRPGDTVGYEMKVENTGKQDAEDIKVVDAMPDSTTYVAQSAVIDSGVASSNFIDGIGFDGDFSNDGDHSGNDFAESSSDVTGDVERIKWALDTISGGSYATLRFQVTID